MSTTDGMRIGEAAASAPRSPLRIPLIPFFGILLLWVEENVLFRDRKSVSRQG